MNSSNKKPVRICFVSPKSYPLFDSSVDAVFGGAEVDLYMLGTELAKDDTFDVSFIVADYAQPDKCKIEGVTLLKSLRFREGSLAGAIKIWRAMKKTEADIYLLKTASPGVPLAVIFCAIHRKIFAYRAASSRECDGTYASQHKILGKIFNWSLRKAGFVTVQNINDRDSLNQTVAVQAQVIPNGHRLPPIATETRDCILWVGRSAQVKQPQLFVDLARQMPDEKFVMICQRATGDNNYDQLCQQARDTKNLDFHERIPFHEIDAFFQRAKILVNTSSSEGFPNTFIEACKAQTAILSYNVNPDGFLDEFNCGICADGDKEKLIKALNELLTDQRYAELGANGRKYVEEKHDITKIVEQYKSVFQELAGERTAEC